MSTINGAINHSITIDNVTYVSPLTITSTGAVNNNGTGSAVTVPGNYSILNQGLISATGTANRAVTGAADPGATVTIGEGSNTLGQTTANNAGLWLFTPTGLVDGVHTLTASETNGAGNTGSGSLTFTLKTAALTPYGLRLSPPAEGNVTTDLSPVVAGVGEPGDSLTLFDQTGGQGTTIVGADGIWSVEAPERNFGSYTFYASEVDIAGNVSAPSSPLVTTVETPNFKHLGDFNGDGSSDMLFVQLDGSLEVVNIAGNQVAGTAFPGQVGPEWHLEGVQDFDHDGTDELIYRRADGALQINDFTSTRSRRRPTRSARSATSGTWSVLAISTATAPPTRCGSAPPTRC